MALYYLRGGMQDIIINGTEFVIEYDPYTELFSLQLCVEPKNIIVKAVVFCGDLSKESTGNQAGFTKILEFTANNRTLEVENISLLRSWVYLEDITKETITNPPAEKPIDVDSKFIEDFSNLFSDEHLKDFTFKVGEQEIKAHKAILSARSSVFKQMFETDMAENSTNSIEIKDASFEAVKAFLEFVYCDKFVDGHLTEELMYLGDKYDVPELEARTANCLMDALNETNAVDLLILFDLHNVTEFKREVIYFVAKNKEKAYPPEKQAELKKSHPVLFEMVETVIYSFNRIMK